ncbi:MAG: hydantoinase/oxoprolinase family protein [Methanolinea sp.]
MCGILIREATPRMLIGMDVGGTNTDLAMVGEEIVSEKVSNTRGIREALLKIRIPGRLAVSTSTPLNRVLAGTPVTVQTILVPGPGLFWPGGVKGAVNHCGDVVEPIDPQEIREILMRDRGDALAIAGKFSVRNPALEKEIASLAHAQYPVERTSMSYHLADLDFPGRIATTRLNAAMKETVTWLAGEIGAERGDVLFFKGDGGLIPPGYAVNNPSVLAHSSAAAVALGARYLSGITDCTVIDIGGTTTDLVPLLRGVPRMELLVHGGERTVTRAVVAQSFPYGGDSLVEGGLLPRRLGDALAFGGSHPTLTDALNVTGEEIGDAAASRRLSRESATSVIETYLDRISRAVSSIGTRHLVGAGYLAPFLVPGIASRCGVRYTIPPHWDCANAVGVAVSRVSLSLHARFDSGRGWVAFNGEHQPLRSMGDDDALVGICKEEVQKRAIAAGAHPEDVRDIEVLHVHSYDVIRGASRSSRIADVVVQVAPGITVKAP